MEVPRIGFSGFFIEGAQADIAWLVEMRFYR